MKFAKIISVVAFVLGICVWWFVTKDQRHLAATQRKINKALIEQEGEDSATGKIYHLDGDDVGDLSNLSKMSESQTIEMAGGMVEQMMASMAERYQRVLDLPPKERNKELDRAIDDQIKNRGEVDRMIEQAKANSEGGKQDGARVVKEEDLGEGEHRVRVGFDGSSGDGEKFLGDHTTAQTRAIMEEYREALAARMKERGLDSADIPITMKLEIDATGTKTKSVRRGQS